MTELQIGLMGLGATAVVGVFAYNKWQEYRHRKLAEAVLPKPGEDVLLGDLPQVPVADAPAARTEPVLNPQIMSPALGDRVEPVLGGAPVTPVPEAVEEDAPILTEVAVPEALRVAMPEAPVAPPVEATVPPAAVAPAAPAVPPAPTPVPPVARNAEAASPETMPPAGGEPPATLLDPRIELIAAFELVEPARAAHLMAAQREVLQRIARPIHWVGFNEQTREWERLKADGETAVRRLRVGLQLVNRLGPVSDADLALFIGAMQALADAEMAVVQLPSPRVQEQAAALDRFSAAVDLEIGINLVSKGVPFSGTKIRALAEAAGMVLGVDGLFTRYDDLGHPQFSLQNLESTPFSAEGIRSLSTHGLTFLLDVPRVAHGERVFLQMIELGRRFAETLQGVLVDDNRVPLGEPQIEHIRREFVGKPQALMVEHGMPAGSPQALRLFS